MKPGKLAVTIPPTRTHKQLAEWINATPALGLYARVDPYTSSTDTKIGRLRWAGKGRRGLKIRVYPRVGMNLEKYEPGVSLFEHTTSETYRTHDEARRWIQTWIDDQLPGWTPSKRKTRRAFLSWKRKYAAEGTYNVMLLIDDIQRPEKPRRKHSRDGHIHCDLCAPLRCVKAKS